MKEFWQDLKKAIRTVPDFPIEGIQFRDITSLLANPLAFNKALIDLTNIAFQGTKVIGIESRGFVFGSAMARDMDTGFIMARKPGKLPNPTYKKDYELEYGTATLELQKNEEISPDDKVVIVDDLIATGGTALACADLVHENWNVPKENILIVAVIDLTDLGGSAKIVSKGYKVGTLVEFEGE